MTDKLSPSDCGELIANANMELGRITGYEQIAHSLYSRSGQEFALHRDATATVFRELADELAEEARLLREMYEAENRAQMKGHRAFEQLEQFDKWEFSS